MPEHVKEDDAKAGSEQKTQFKELNKSHRFFPTRTVGIGILSGLAGSCDFVGAALLNSHSQPVFIAWGLIFVGLCCGCIAGRLWIINHRTKHQMPDWLDSNWTCIVGILFCLIVCAWAAWWTKYKEPDSAKSEVRKWASPNVVSSTNLSIQDKIEVAKLVGEITQLNSENAATNQATPGFSWHLLIRLKQPTPGRNNFIADTGERFDQNRISIFIDADKNLCFRIIGDDGKPTTLQVHSFYDTFLFENKMWLACDYGMAANSCFIRMYVNGKLVAENIQASRMKSPEQWMTFNPVMPASVNGSVFISDGIVFGQDMNFDNGGAFELAAFMLFKAALPPNELGAAGKALGWIDGLHDHKPN